MPVHVDDCYTTEVFFIFIYAGFYHELFYLNVLIVGQAAHKSVLYKQDFIGIIYNCSHRFIPFIVFQYELISSFYVSVIRPKYIFHYSVTGLSSFRLV